MTFDELWRLHLERKSAPVGSVDTAEAVAPTAVPGENANELLLTAEDLSTVVEPFGSGIVGPPINE